MALVTYCDVRDALWPYNLSLEHSEQFEGSGVRMCMRFEQQPRLILLDFKILLYYTVLDQFMSDARLLRSAFHQYL